MSEKDLQNNNNQENNENITEKNENKTEKKDCDKDKVREQIIKVLQNVYDPEIHVDIWNLGLI